MDRRLAFGQIAAGAAVVAALPQLALADGAVSAATKARARAVNGAKILALKSAVEAGDFEAVAEAKNAFVLFNSGVYPSAKEKSKKKEAITATNAIFSAIKSGDKAALKSAYSKYVASNDISPLSAAGKNGQGGYSDYDYKVRTPAGAVYVR